MVVENMVEAMLGCAPSTIITDNDKAKGKAIIEVRPNTNYRLYLWHILQKVSEASEKGPSAFEKGSSAFVAAELTTR